MTPPPPAGRQQTNADAIAREGDGGDGGAEVEGRGREGREEEGRRWWREEVEMREEKHGRK